MTELNNQVEQAAEATQEVVRKVTPMVKAQRALGKITFQVSKHSPLILTGVGIIGIGTTAYLAYKSRDKVNSIVTEMEVKQDKAARLEEYRLLNRDDLSENQERDFSYLESEEKDGALVIDKPRYVRDLIAVTALPISVGLASGVAIGSSYIIQNRRLAGMAAALATTTAEHKYLRDRMEKKYGKEEVERLETVEEEEQTYTDAKGKEKTKKVEVRAQTPANSMSGRWFQDSTEYTSDDHQYNLEFLRAIQRKLDTKIFQRGYLRFNEVMDALGLDRVKSGEEFGWNTATGFELNFQTNNFEVTDDLIPQIYIRWTRPISIYHDVDYNGGRYE